MRDGSPIRTPPMGLFSSSRSSAPALVASLREPTLWESKRSPAGGACPDGGHGGALQVPPNRIGSTMPAFGRLPCQPYSAQGDQQGMRDSRGQTPISILRASWCLQSVGLILECVHNARHNVDVQNLLAQYANLRRWQVHHVTLDLQDQWAMVVHHDPRRLTSALLLAPVAQHQPFSQCGISHSGVACLEQR